MAITALRALIEAKAAAVGTRHKWKTGTVVKQRDGSWKPTPAPAPKLPARMSLDQAHKEWKLFRIVHDAHIPGMKDDKLSVTPSAPGASERHRIGGVEGEDRTTARVSVAPTIHQAASGVTGWTDTEHWDLGEWGQLEGRRVYGLREIPKGHVPNEKLHKLVPDAHLTGEEWLTQPAEMEYLGHLELADPEDYAEGRDLDPVHLVRRDPKVFNPPEKWKEVYGTSGLGERIAALRRLLSEEATRKLYHLADKPDFKLDPRYKPSNNTTLGGDFGEGIYLTSDVEHWVNGYGYWRPWVIEFEVPANLGELPGVLGGSKGWGYGGKDGELMIPAQHYDKLRISRVMPLDAWCREEFGDYGWTEEWAEKTFDDKPLARGPHGRTKLPSGYRFNDDVRRWPRKRQVEYERRVKEFRKHRTNAIAAPMDEE